MAEAGEDVLRLETARVRRGVVVDGTRYELRDPDELALREANALQALLKQVGPVMEGEEVAEDRMGKLEAALDLCVATIMPGCPAEVRGKLTDAQKMNLIAAFSSARTPAPAAGQPDPAPTASPA